jgi:hypothetical protein
MRTLESRGSRACKVTVSIPVREPLPVTCTTDVYSLDECSWVVHLTGIGRLDGQRSHWVRSYSSVPGLKSTREGRLEF